MRPAAAFLAACALGGAAVLPQAPLAASPAAVSMPRGGGVINLNCMEALVSIGERGLAGIFSFIEDKDTGPAFADLLVHRTKDLKRFLGANEKKLSKDGGIPRWNHEVLAYVLSIYAQMPPGADFKKPPKSVILEISRLFDAPALTLSQISGAGK